MLNRSELASPLGVSVPTISEWLAILEITSQILPVLPFFENFGKRLIKSPKLYFADPGLLCHLLGIDSAALLDRSPFLGPVFECFVASEIVKHQLNGGRARALYYFRDQQGLGSRFRGPRGRQADYADRGQGFTHGPPGASGAAAAARGGDERLRDPLAARSQER